MVTKIFLLAFAAFAFASVGSCLKITLCARDLPAKDPNNGAPDTYVNVYYATSATAPYELLGRTKYVVNNKNPDFPEIFEVPDSGDSTQALKFDIYDADAPEQGDDYIGYVWTRISDIKKDSDGVWSKYVSGTGAYLYVKVQKD